MQICEKHFVRGGEDTRLYVRIKGLKRARPPLLYLHGGPGSGINLAAFEIYAGPLLERYIPVAYLHQRGVLYSEEPGAKKQTLFQHIEDIRAVVAFLCERFETRHVYLLGHSWGGFTGFLYLAQYEQTIAGLVTLSPIVSFPDTQQDLYDLVSAQVLSARDASARRELELIGPPPYTDIDAFIWLQGLAVEIYGDPYAHIIPGELTTHIGYELDMDRLMAVQTGVARALWPELFRLDLTADLLSAATPLLMITGRLDAAVPWVSSEKAFKQYGKHSPRVRKRWLLLEKSNHLAFTELDTRAHCMAQVVDFLKP